MFSVKKENKNTFFFELQTITTGKVLIPIHSGRDTKNRYLSNDIQSIQDLTNN